MPATLIVPLSARSIPNTSCAVSVRAGTEQPGDTHHLALANVEVERIDVAAFAKAAQRDQRFGLRRIGVDRALDVGLELTAEHHRDQLQAIETSDRYGVDQSPIAQHRDGVSDLVNLIEEMADEDDAHAARAQLPNHGEQHLHLVGIETGRWLVEHQHLAGDIDGAGDRDHLLDGNREIGERRSDVDLEPVGIEDRPRPAVHLAHVGQAETLGLPPEEKVFGHREVGQEVDLLIDGADSELLRIDDVAWINGGAFEQDLAFVSTVGARDDLDERRLACAVLAEKSMHFTGLQGEIDILERGHAEKGLADSAYG